MASMKEFKARIESDAAYPKKNVGNATLII